MSMTSVIACLDVAYGVSAAAVAAALIPSWDAERAIRLLVRRVDGPSASYEPGAFYKRELPLLLSLICEFEQPIEAVVIDGYVWLDANTLPGLGGHLFASLGSRTPVIGIAKSRYRNETWSIPVLRGTSERPLLVTSAGIHPKEAADRVRCMHGEHRIPTILSLVDRAARDGLAACGPQLECPHTPVSD